MQNTRVVTRKSSFQESEVSDKVKYTLVLSKNTSDTKIKQKQS